MPDMTSGAVRSSGVDEFAAGFTFDDDTGLIAWPAPDRGVITLASGTEYAEHADAITGLVARWFSI